MKQLPLVLSSLALAGVVGLFIMQQQRSSKSGPKPATSADSLATHTHGQIGYFEMDSIERHYAYIKEVQAQIKKQEESITNELNSLKKNYMGRIQQLQSKAPNMSQQEGEAAQAEINQMQVNMQQKEAQLSQALQEKQFKMMQDINSRITDYVKQYNQQKKFAYIISHQPGDFIYFTDTAFNITSDILKGLNEAYKKPE
ncbi:MAG TPA: OmpH family outer membrane protein [Phnomibacter sp.]|nr:OmpH family outer membrane protein [Phnomibacter sp.]